MCLPHNNSLRMTGSHIIVKLKTQLPRSRSSESQIDEDSLVRFLCNTKQIRKNTTRSYYRQTEAVKIDCKGHDPAEITK